MSKNILNNIQDNLEDFSYGVQLPVIKLNKINYLIGLQYTTNDINYRNLYTHDTQNYIKIGVVKYLTPTLTLQNNNDYEVFLQDY